MFRKLAIALVASTLVAGPVFAQNTSTSTPTGGAVATQPATNAPTAPVVKKVKHARKHMKGMQRHSGLHAKHIKRVKHAKHAKVSKRHLAQARVRAN